MSFNTFQGRFTVLFGALSTLLAGALFPMASDAATHSAKGLRPRVTAPERLFATVRDGLDRTDRIVVKFREGTAIRLREGRLVSIDQTADLDGIEGFLARNPEITVSRHFRRSEAELDRAQRDGQARSGWQLANLNLYYQFQIPHSGDPVAAAQTLLDELNGLQLVEIAFVEPIAEPAVILGGGAEMGAADPAVGGTPDFSGMQGYLYASPSGVNAEAVWGFPGGRGAGVKIVDIEGAWLWDHEDLIQPFFEGGVQVPNIDWRNHGTAVMGEMVGQPNGFGVTGIAADMEVGGASIQTMNVAEAIDLAAANIDPGDMFLIELHAPGPNGGGGQFGYVCMEYWQDNFDAVQTAVASGRICVEAGGNGQQNLDDPIYQGLFDRNVRNSGAIVVGAGTPNTLEGEWFTNYGSRLDLNGWGSSVTTCGYGTLQGGAETEWYTSGFGGTSSASPIVCGSVGVLQGMSKAEYGVTLDAQVIREILYETGTDWVGAKEIGKRPNLVDARAMLLEGVGTIGGTVTDASTQQPVEGAVITIVETDKTMLSGADGGFSLPVVSGDYTVRVESFFHVTDEQIVAVGAGENVVHDVELAPKPTGALSGIVRNENMQPLSGVRVEIMGSPLFTFTSLDGSYGFGAVPEGAHSLIIGPSRGHGSAYRTIDVVPDAQSNQLDVTLVTAETFETDDGGYNAPDTWEWGSPSGQGPSGAHSGSNLWATELSGFYPADAASYLRTPPMDFSEANEVYLSFMHWYDIESAWDGGQVQVLNEAWMTLEPIGGYPQAALAGLDWGEGYSGTSDGWEIAIFDLTPYLNSSLRVRWWFGSDGAVQAPGWYIDDVAFEVDATSSSAPDLAGGPRIVLSPAGPNPFVRSTDLRLELPSASRVDVRVFDAAGRLVRSLYEGSARAGVHVLSWDGLTDRGVSAPAGAYFYRLEVDGRSAGSGRLVRIR